jgi:hypothetical protein
MVWSRAVCVRLKEKLVMHVVSSPARKFKFSTGINRKLNNNKPFHVGFEVLAAVLLLVDVFTFSV